MTIKTTDDLMQIDYPRYERYKDSGVDWLGEIPEGWNLLKVKNIFRLAVNYAEKNNGHELLSVYTEIGVKPRKELEERGNKASTTDGYLMVEKGDIVVNKLLAWMGAIGISNYDGVTSPAYDILKAYKPINGLFYHYLFRNPRFVSELKRHSRGIMNMRLRLYFDKFGGVLVPFPPLEIQNKTVEFIESRTTQINQAITLKQQQITKLEEYKQIVIQNAVTKGLNPDVSMKDSGVDWIGDIPEHWEVKKLKRIAVVNPRVRLNNLEYDEPVSFLPMEKVSVNGDIDCSLKRPLNEVKQGFTVFEKDDVILAKITPCFENGKGALLDRLDTRVGFGSTEFHVIRANKDINKKYLYNVTQSPIFLKVGEKMMVGSAGQKRVPTDFVSNYEVALPSLEEQHDINEFIDNTSIKIRESIEVQRKQIDRLKEYKTILINQAVTGKIKVS